MSSNGGASKKSRTGLIGEPVRAFDAIAIVGPTASGKSALALQLATALNGEIVSCDSVQVYRGFDIGSAKPTPVEQGAVPHHLINMIDWRESMDAGKYARAAAAVLTDLRQRGRLPIIVGGTGLYLRALLADRWHGELPKDETLRASLNEQSNTQLQATLMELDPARARELHSNDRVRLLRAVELATLAGDNWRSEQASAPPLTSPIIVRLEPERSLLHERIAVRAGVMLECGLVDEVRGLLAGGCPPTARPMQAIGYKQVVDYLNGTIAETELATTIAAATRQYAKRQTTWFKKLVAQFQLPLPPTTSSELAQLVGGINAMLQP